MLIVSLSQETDFEATEMTAKLHAVLITPKAFAMTEKGSIPATNKIERLKSHRHQFEEEQARGLEFLFGSQADSLADMYGNLCKTHPLMRGPACDLETSMRNAIEALIVVAHLSRSGSTCAFGLYPGFQGVSRQGHNRSSLLQSFTGFRFLWARKEDATARDGRTSASMSSSSDHRHAPAAKRNREVISKELCTWLAKDAGDNYMLEIASGTGCHAEAFAKSLPSWTFQPTEYDEKCIPDIVKTIKEGGYTNIRPPVALDVCSNPSTWPRPSSEGDELWDAIISINMIHIAPKECTTGLLTGAAAGLKQGGHLFMYGPFALNGMLEPDSNKAFHESLMARSGGQWGIRDAAWVADLADEFGLKLTAITLMPANNFLAVFTKVREPGDLSSPDERVTRVAEIISTVIMPTREAFEKALVAR